MQLTAEFFSQNRKNLTNQLPKKGIVVIAGNGRMQRNADNPYAFRQDSNFYYLTGIEEPCAVLVMDTVHNQEWIMLPVREGIHAIFDGIIDVKKISQQSGVAEILDEKSGWKRLMSLRSAVPVFMPKKPMAKVGDTYSNPFRATVAKKVQAHFVHIVDIRPIIANLRVIKSEPEISIIDAAARTTIDTIEKIEHHLEDFKNESEIEAEISYQFRRFGATGHAFSPIVASGDASCTLHYLANNQEINSGPILLDIGAEISNYSADISRTLLRKESPERQREIVHAVKRAQAAIIAQLKPGISWADIATIADIEMGNVLLKLGCVKKGFSKRDVRTYFPHAVSHFLGLDTHDVGDYTKPLAPGTVITIEPGIYLPDEGFGVRFEDDILITEHGSRILGLS